MFFSEYKIQPTMTLTQRQVYQESAFRLFKIFNIPAAVNGVDGTFDILIQHGPSAVHLFNRLVSASLPNVIYEVRANPIATPTQDPAIEIFNMNAYSDIQSNSQANICTVTNEGQLVDLYPLGGSVDVGNRLSGDESIEPDDIKILKHDQNFLLRFKNPNNEVSQGFLYLKWFETSPPRQQ